MTDLYIFKRLLQPLEYFLHFSILFYYISIFFFFFFFFYFFEKQVWTDQVGCIFHSGSTVFTQSSHRQCYFYLYESINMFVFFFPQNLPKSIRSILFFLPFFHQEINSLIGLYYSTVCCPDLEITCHMTQEILAN